MKVLLDHTIPHTLRPLLSDEHEVHTTKYLGWSDYEDHQLLTAAVEASFAALVTLDRSLPHQQKRRPLPSASSFWTFIQRHPLTSKRTWTASSRPCPALGPINRSSCWNEGLHEAEQGLALQQYRLPL